MLKDLTTQNKKIVDHFTSVIAIGESLTDRDGFLWLGVDWTKRLNVNLGIQLLQQLVCVMVTFINDTQVMIGKLTDVDQAKTLIERNTLISPFIKTKGGDYKLIRTVTHLLPGGRIQFIANKFSQMNIRDFSKIIESKKPLFQPGGGQTGGVFLRIEHLGMESVIVLNAAVAAGGGGGGGSHSRENQRIILGLIDERHTSPNQVELDRMLKEQIKYHDTIPQENIGRQSQELIGQIRGIQINTEEVNYDVGKYFSTSEAATFGQDTSFPGEIEEGMFYCLVKDFHPEIFTYARFIALFLDPSSPLCEDGFGLKYYNEEDSYIIEETTGKYKINIDYSGPGYHERKHLNMITKTAIEYADAFTTTFPDFLTSSLFTFMNKTFSHYSRMFKRVDNIDSHKLLGALKGGGLDDLESAANQAIELYEPYYSLLLQKNYTPDLHLRDMIKERLEFIIPFDLSIPHELEHDKSYVRSRKDILKLMINELATLPKVQEHMKESRKHVEHFYRYHHNKIEATTISELLMSLAAHDSSRGHRISHKHLHAHLVQKVRGGRFSNLRITRKTRRVSERKRSTYKQKRKIRGKKNKN